MSATLETFGVPQKKASDIEILKPLKNLITSRYQTAEQDSYIGAINELAKLRTNAVAKNLECHESSLDVVYRWVLLRAPEGGGGGKGDCIKGGFGNYGKL